MGLLLDFQDENLELEFRTQFVTSQLRHIRFAVGFAAGLMLGFGLVDSLLYGDETDQIRLWFTRLLIFTPMAVIFIHYTYNDRFPQNAQSIGFWAAAMVGTIWLLAISDDGLHRSLFLMPNLIESAVYSLFLIGLTLKFSVFLTLFLCLLYTFILIGFGLSARMNVAISLSLIVILGLLVLCAYQRETVARTLFLKNKDEQQATRRHILENQRDLDWLRGLAGFLRHEVRQPVALVSSSLDIMQLNGPKEDIARQIQSAETGVRQVWSLIDRATRATDVEAFVRQGQAQSVDANSLIGLLVEEYRQTYSGVHFAFDAFDKPVIEPMMLRVDPELFREAIRNLLSNAASFADDGSEVTIALTKNTDAVVVTVVNQGPTIEGDIESLFSPFRSTRAGANSDHQGLGLYLVRLVAQHYGGTATLENRQDQGGVAASISIPFRGSAAFR
jgi:signal transduction histidine kinase